MTHVLMVSHMNCGVPDTIISDSYSITHEFGESSGVSGIHDSLLLTYLVIVAE